MVNVSSSAGNCCLALSSALDGLVSYPGNTTYTASLDSYFSLLETAVQPSCILSPQTATDVSTAVSILAATNSSGSAGSGSCQFAVRSGGHASFVGAANIQDGVTIDLSGLANITSSPASGQDTYAETQQIVSAGVGLTWGAVYAYLDPLQLSAIGGRVAGVGVGGLTLGGGISYFGPRFGWACDAVTNFEVVLGNGTIVNASEDENQDLMWALRGGQNNFGIVTRVDIRAFAQGDFWGGQVIRAIDTTDDQINALAAYTNPESYDEYASLITTFAYSGDGDLQVVVNDEKYTKPIADPPVFDAWKNMTALVSTQRITNMSDLAAEQAAQDPDGDRQASATLTIDSTVDAINATVAAWNTSIATIRDIPGITWSLGFDPLLPQLYARHAGSNALGLGDRQNRTLIVVNINIKWSNATDDGAVDEAARSLIAAIERDVGQLDALDPFIYINYAASWQRPIDGYGEDSLEKLQSVREKYDPGHVFTNLVPGGFKIPA